MHTHTHTHTRAEVWVYLPSQHKKQTPPAAPASRVASACSRANYDGESGRAEREREREMRGRFFHSLRPWWFKDFHKAELTCDEWQDWFCELRCHGDALRELLAHMAAYQLSEWAVAGADLTGQPPRRCNISYDKRTEIFHVAVCDKYIRFSYLSDVEFKARRSSIRDFTQLDVRKVGFHITSNYFGDIRFDLLKICFNILYIFHASVPQLWGD